MNFEEFQVLARLYVLGGLDADEHSSFEEARESFGARAEDYLRECRHLASGFALSLKPSVPKRGAREKLLSLIRNAGRPAERPARRWFH